MDCCRQRGEDHLDRSRSGAVLFSSDSTRCCLWMLGYRIPHDSSVFWALMPLCKSSPRCCPRSRFFFLVGVADFPSFDPDCCSSTRHEVKFFLPRPSRSQAPKVWYGRQITRSHRFDLFIERRYQRYPQNFLFLYISTTTNNS